ncbi:MAG: LacI family transcriptional regulator [Chitinophagaceae bacterium]|jgi:LacI family transcriptional regulator|nr:LacI family transcriptional regulator [Chitinophagaceae bacterium]
MVKEITIYDLAKELNYSAATISRALQDDPSVKPKTKKKIIDLAEKKGYRMNYFASSLRKKKTHTIGVMLHELNSNFIITVLAGIEKVLSDTQYDIIIAHSGESGKKEVANAHNLFHKRVDGLIASLAYDTPNLDHFNQFIEKKIPVIFFDRVEENSNGTKVIIDNYKAGYEAAKHLIEQGCKRIAHITANLSRNVYGNRFEGYKAALKDHHLKFTDSHLIVTDLRDRDKCMEAAVQIAKMKPLPDGLFITNDISAAIVMQKLKELGIKMPEDIAVVGFNNDIVSTIVEPHLTTIDYPGIIMGEVAARNLLNHLNGNGDISLTSSIVIKSELIARQSSLKRNLKI